MIWIWLLGIFVFGVFLFTLMTLLMWNRSLLIFLMPLIPILFGLLVVTFNKPIRSLQKKEIVRADIVRLNCTTVAAIGTDIVLRDNSAKTFNAPIETVFVEETVKFNSWKAPIETNYCIIVKEKGE